jgi:hypothetical protein
MAIEKDILGRIVHKHDTETNWDKATGFIPKQGEIIVYDVDTKYSYQRMKIGDGKTAVPNLPFCLSAEIDAIMTKLDKKVEVSLDGSTLIFTH